MSLRLPIAYLLKGLSEQNESSVKAIEVPPELVTYIRTALETLQTATVAVRSSATAEDLAEASFAGQTGHVFERSTR